MSERGAVARLSDILSQIDAVRNAEDRLHDSEQAGDQELAAICLAAINYSLVVIGEAVKQLDSDVLSRHPDIPWSEIAKMRDFLAHQYFKIDAATVRQAIDQPMSELYEACKRELSDLNS